MPRYCYTCGNCGHTTQVSQSVQAPRPESRRCPLCQGKARRDFQAEAPKAHEPGTYPMHSYAAGVHPDQAGEAYEASVRMGVPTRFDPKSGDAIFRSKKHRRRYCEAKGLYDRNAGHSDPDPDRSADTRPNETVTVE